jgi:uncharacterized protein YggE
MPSETTPAGPLLSVRGAATLEVPPEIAELRVHVAARDGSRDRALERLSRRNDECLAALRGYGDAVERVETSGLAVYPELGVGWRKEKVRAYRGVVRIQAVVTRFDVLGELVVRVADNDMTTLDGPWWRLRQDSPAHREARQAAARDAITRAREYAEGVGSRLTGLVELADVGLVARAVDGARPEHLASFALRARAPEEPASIQLEPQVQVVEAQVEARFTISPPEQL